MPNVAYTRNEVGALLQQWYLIRDALEGEPAIKGEFGVRANYYNTAAAPRNQAKKYLPMPNPLDTSPQNQARYEQYVKRAVWYNWTSRTRDGLVGQVYLRPPVVKIPDGLKALSTNADGNGLTVEQVSKRATQNAISYGRGGLLTDYPATAGALTKAEMAKGDIQPVIMSFYPWQIINWATIQKGAMRVLSLVVIEEFNLIESGDSFSLEEEVTYRVLRLTNGQYTVERWGVDINTKAFSSKGVVTPTGNDGKPLDFIPFMFVGSEANDIWPDRAPLYDLASLNIAHYRNSADYEEACFLVGQPTSVISGVTEQWVVNVLKGSIMLGSRSSISLPEGGKAELLQATANQMPLEAMKLKEEQALGIGAKLVQSSKKVRTATEVMVDTTSESSVLYNVATNVSAAMEQCLRWACVFSGDDDSEIEFQLNTEFELTRMDANDRLALIKIWQSGAIAFPEMRDVLRVDGTASMDDDEALGLLQKEQAQAALLGAAAIADPLQAVTALAPTNVPSTPTAPRASKPNTAKPAKKAAKKVASK